MRNKIIFLIAIAVLALGLTACGTAVAQAVEPSTRTLSVTGSAQVFLVPDIAYISIGVQTQNAEASQAVAENNALAAQVVQQLRSQGIAERDIRTSNFSIYPSQEYDREGMLQNTFFVVNNTVQVTIRDLNSLGQILDTSVDAGANSIHSIQFDVADKSAAMSGARQNAIDNAKAMAEEISTAAGVTLGQVHSINFYGGGIPVPVYDLPASRAAVEMDVPISTGELSFTVEVNMTFEIR